MNVLNLERTILPSPIHEYITQIGNTITADGESVLINIPDATLPRGEPNAVINNQFSGSFGLMADDTASAYTTQWSPNVSQGYFHGCVQFQPGNAVAWLPDILPEGWEANANLLGYRPLEAIAPAAMAVVAQFAFKEGEGTRGRLCHSVELMETFYTQMLRMKPFYPTVQGWPVPKVIAQNVGFVESTIAPQAGQSIYSPNADLYGNCQLGTSGVGRLELLCQRRRRSRNNAGSPVVAPAGAIFNFVAHRNDNFEMIGDYGPENSTNLACQDCFTTQSYHSQEDKSGNKCQSMC